MSGGYMIRAELYNPGHPEYGVATIPFPIPREEYDHILELLEPMEIGDPVQRDCGISELDSFYTVLDRMSGLVNLDELDYLAKRLESFDDYEAAQFQTMAAKLNLTDMTDLINLTFCCQQATVITDFSNLERIGKDHYMILQGGCCSTKELEELDGVETAMFLISDNKGEITPYGVVYDNGMKLEQLYDGVHFPAYSYRPSPLTLEVADQRGGSVYLHLPLSDGQMDRLLQRAGHTRGDVDYTVECHTLSPGVLAVVNRRNSSVPALNRMCQGLAQLDQLGRAKLDAAMVMANPGFASDVEALIKNLDLFDFVPGVSNMEELGRYMIQQSGRFEYDENLAEFYDYEKYGRQKAELDGGGFVEQGYIAYRGCMSLDELMMEESSDQGFQMGGIS